MESQPERLAADVLKEWFSYDADSGCITWKKSKTYVSAGAVAGCHCAQGYWVIGFGGKRYRAHRIAWVLHYGDWPPDGFMIDHVNGNRGDNSIANLRLATQTQNRANSKLDSKNTSGEKGVSWSKRERKWRAYIRLNGKQSYLGMYARVEDAAHAYRAAAVHHFGEFANFG